MANVLNFSVPLPWLPKAATLLTPVKSFESIANSSKNAVGYKYVPAGLHVALDLRMPKATPRVDEKKNHLASFFLITCLAQNCKDLLNLLNMIKKIIQMLKGSY